MRKIKDSIAVIGEGITEYYYFNSVKDEYKQLNFKPTCPKHSTNISELEYEIENAIDMEYSFIFCIIDMDNKKDSNEKQAYENLKNKYQGKHKFRRTTVEYEIRFIETERCTELFFLFYFAYTSRQFQNQPELMKALNKFCLYEKTEKFFKSHSLHQYFQSQDGNFMMALQNAAKSMKDKEKTERDYTYSQMAELFEVLDITPKKLKNIRK